MIPPLAFLVPSDHQDLGPLSDLLRLPQNSGLLHSHVLGEVHRHRGTLRLAALVAFVPYGRWEHMGECTLMDKQVLPFSGRLELFNSVDSILMSVPYLLLKSLSVPSFPPSAFGSPDFLSLIFQIEHQSLQPFSALGIGYGIDNGSLVLEGPLF